MKHTRALLLSATLSSLALASAPPAEAGNGRPGRKGTVAAYDLSGDVLTSRACARKKYTWDYVTCGKLVRARVKTRLCSSLGKGTHRYLYQVGSGKRTRSSVYCKSGRVRADGDVSTGNPGHRGTVTAYFPHRGKVFDSQRCRKVNRAWRYTTCGKLLRQRVKRRLCRLRGKGKHTYFYQVSDNKKARSSVFCKH